MSRNNISNNVQEITSYLEDRNANFAPNEYYYTPITMHPRSLSSPVNNFTLPESDFSETRTMFYFHIPFCSTRCTFCPFYLDVSQGVDDFFIQQASIHTRVLLQQITSLPRTYTVYLGGGSPNLLAVDQVERLLSNLISNLNGKTPTEVSMELHPEVIKGNGYLDALKKIGVSRLSFGLQSTDPVTLKRTARHHNVEELERAVAESKSLGFKVNIDLMFGGFPGETLEQDETAFRYAFSGLNPDWVTIYQTCIQQGTPEFERYQREKTNYPSPEVILQARELRHLLAQENGYHYLGGDYFAKAETNPAYQDIKWGDKNAVLAIGPGSYSYIVNGSNLPGCLFWAPFNNASYYETLSKQQLPVERSASFSGNEMERWVTIGRLKTQKASGADLSPSLINDLQTLYQEGFLDKAVPGYTINSRGILIEDLICASLMPHQMWVNFQRKREEPEYDKDAKYDWFFKPNPVLRFQNALELGRIK